VTATTFVDMIAVYSNRALTPVLESLLRLCDQPAVEPVPRTPRRDCRRLTAEEVSELVKAYALGELVAHIATRFAVDQVTVHKYVRAAGLPKRCHWIGPRQLEHAVELYQCGKSTSSIAAELGVGATTVRRALQSAGIGIRRRGRKPAAQR
jgi:transposase-like protein